MGDRSAIEWTDATWNPLRGCTRVSEGCRNCYAESVAARFSGPGQPYEGLATRGPARWTGKVRFVEEHLTDPLRWTRPRRIFVNSMSDLFHESVPDEWLLQIFTVMAQAITWCGPRHTFQILTKRPERMHDFMRRLSWKWGSRMGGPWRTPWTGDRPLNPVPTLSGAGNPEPLGNIWLGVSIEDQATADERIPHLLKTPAAVRFISAEPLLGPVDLRPILYAGECRACSGRGTCGVCDRGVVQRAAIDGLDWVIVGGESGPGARPCDVAWIRDIIAQCRNAGVPVFCKQLGAVVVQRTEDFCRPGAKWGESVHSGEYCGGPDDYWQGMTRFGARPHEYVRIDKLRDRKGGDPAEWPKDLRVREMPT